MPVPPPTHNSSSRDDADDLDDMAALLGTPRSWGTTSTQHRDQARLDTGTTAVPHLGLWVGMVSLGETGCSSLSAPTPQNVEG